MLGQFDQVAAWEGVSCEWYAQPYQARAVVIRLIGESVIIVEIIFSFTAFTFGGTHIGLAELDLP